MLKITVDKETRGLKAGTVYDFTEGIDATRCLAIVGENGCGKSTVMQALRGKYDTRSQSLYKSDFKTLSEDFTVEADYEEYFFFDAVKDNGTDFMNAYDASNFLQSGGMAANRMSHGQGALMYLSKFLDDNVKRIKEGKTLVVFDEVDGGLSLANSARFINLVRNLAWHHKCHVVVISHNPFFIIDMVECYDFPNKQYIASSEYVEKTTGFLMDHKTRIF